MRVLAATNVQLEKAINAGHFREDLYYRLDVVSLELSPLRDRPGDILPLTRHFIEAYSQRLGYGPITISREAEHKLKSYSWPGNIRELENVIHHTLLICRNGVIERDDLRLSNMRIERQDDSQHGTEYAQWHYEQNRSRYRPAFVQRCQAQEYDQQQIGRAHV